MSACGSGCNVPSATGSSNPATWYTTANASYTQSSVSVDILFGNICSVPRNICNSGDFFGNVTAYYNGAACTVNGVYIPLGQDRTFTCVFNGYGGSIGAYQINGSAVSEYDYSGTQFLFDYGNANAGSANGYYSESYGACDNAINQSASNAQQDAHNQATSRISGRTIVWVGDSYSNKYCNPAPGQQYQQSTFQGWATDTATADGFYPNDAITYARNQLNGQLPNGYYWTGTPSCSPTTSNINGWGNSYTINCPIQQQADYDWRSSSPLGQQNVSTLAQKLTGMSVANAQQLCNANYPGIQAGSCKITVSGGTGSMPNAASSITVSAVEP